MSTDTLSGRASLAAAVETWTTDVIEASPAPREQQRPTQHDQDVAQPALGGAPTPDRAEVSAALLAAHAVDRADARLERLRDELDLLRGSATPGSDIDPEETRLIFAIAKAEQSRRSLDAL